jgi:hypothetical protein
MTQTSKPQTPATLTAPFTGDQFRAADLNTVQLFFRDGAPVILGASLPFLLGSWEGDFDGMAANLTEIDAERAGERG